MSGNVIEIGNYGGNNIGEFLDTLLGYRPGKLVLEELIDEDTKVRSTTYVTRNMPFTSIEPFLEAYSTIFKESVYSILKYLPNKQIAGEFRIYFKEAELKKFLEAKKESQDTFYNEIIQ